MISAQTFFAAAPQYDSVDAFLQVLWSLDPTVPQNTTSADSQPGNVGWEMFGWNNANLSSLRVSQQYFWNGAQSYLGWNETYVMNMPVQGQPTTQSTVTSSSSSTVTPVTGPTVVNNLTPSTTVNTTNNVAPSTTDVASGSGVVGQVNTGMGCFNPISGMFSSDTCVGPLGMYEWGALALAAFILFNSAEKGHRG